MNRLHETIERVLTSAAALGIVPIVIIFLFTQKYIIAGVAGGDVGNKG